MLYTIFRSASARHLLLEADSSHEGVSRLANSDPSLDDRVYSYILDGLTSRRFFPGSRLNEEECASACGVSRSPVRAALLRLKEEGIVEILPGRGAFVAHPTREEIQKVFDLRCELEAYVAGRAAGRFTKADGRVLMKLVATQTEEHSRQDRLAVLNVAFEFHMAVARIADHPLAEKFLRQMIIQCNLYQLFYDPFSHSPPMSVEEHAEIVRALEGRDPLVASEAARRHARSLFEHQLDLSHVRSSQQEV